MKFKFNFFIFLASLLIVNFLKAEDIGDLELNTRIFLDFRNYYFSGNKKNLNSDMNSYADDYTQAMLKLHEKIKFHNLIIPIKLKINEKYSYLNRDNYVKFNIDELLVDYSITDSFIFNVGRKQMNNGFALGYNPTDYINKNKYQDLHLSYEDRKSEIEGSDIIGFLYYLNSSSIELYFLPKSQDFYLLYSDNLSQINTNIGLSYYYSNYSSIGINISTTLSDKLTAYIEESISNKRDRMSLIHTLSRNELIDNKDGFYSNFVVGTQYTTNNGVNFNFEYWNNQNGYSKKEYLGLRNYIYSAQSSMSEKHIFSKLSNIYKNKLFFRISDIPLADPVSIDTALIYSLSDESIYYSTTINYSLSQNITIRLDGNMFRGSSYSEYGQTPIDSGVYLSIGYLF